MPQDDMRETMGRWDREGSVELTILLTVVFVVGIVAAIFMSDEAITSRARKRLGAPTAARLLTYEGGHPELAPARVLVWGDGNAIHVAGANRPGKISIPLSEVESLSVAASIHHVATGGGRSIKGAVVGAALMGSVGAIVGGMGSAPKNRRIDESKTVLAIRYAGATTVNLVFAGGQQTQTKLAVTLKRAA